MTDQGRRAATAVLALVVPAPVMVGLLLWPEGLITYVLAAAALLFGLMAGVALGEAKGRAVVEEQRRMIRRLRRELNRGPGAP